MFTKLLQRKYCALNFVTRDMGRAGLTLIEVLLSLSMLATIFSIIFVVFFTVLEGKKLSEDTGEIYQNLRAIFNVMETDIQAAQILLPEKGCCFYGTDNEEGGEGMDSLTLTTLRENVLGRFTTDQRYVRYEPVYIPDLKSTVLYRKEMLFRNEQPELAGQKGIDLGTGLYGVNLRYYSQGRWGDTWDSTQKKSLPESVEIEVYLKDRFDERLRFVYLVPIEAE
ncbi:MAG: hypothetical protein ACE5FU_05030, partial [Nitrospinota bacterium]